ncbi:MAG: phosphatase PAP2 family protein [Methanobacteriota archaeon]|nr:MAG: phosphatase PAP2 family protein [Euryarchaeota archaeon]
MLPLAAVPSGVGFGPDEVLFRILNLAGVDPIADAAMLLITALGVEYILGLLVLPLWVTGRREAAFDFVLVLGIVILFTLALKYGVGRPRPCEVLPDAHTLVGHGCESRDPSFPSGHASRTFALAGFVFLRFRWRAGVPALAFATLVGYSRIYLGLHWPTDVLGGAFLGVAVALLVEVMSRRVVRYQRVRARIIGAVRAVPRFFRRHHALYPRSPFAFVSNSSTAFPRAGDRFCVIATKNIFPVTSRIDRTPPSDSTATWLGAWTFIVA